MAYTALDKILAAHYNTFVAGAGTFGAFDNDIANINTIWGVGFSDKGYGQSTVLDQVPIGSTVSATQWATLITRLLSAANHQVTSLGNLPGDGGGGGPALTGGDLIAAITTLQTSVNDIFSNRLNHIATATTDVENAAGSSTWDDTSVHTINVQFTSADAARHFFNAGGNIAITGALTGGTPAKTDSWDDGAGAGILPESGIVRLEVHATTKTGGSGTLDTDYFIEGSTGYYELGTSPIQIFQQFTIGGGVYASNNITITAQTNGVQGPSGDNGSLITFVVTLNDVVTSGDPVDGTTTITATVNYPATTHLTQAAWGTVTFVPASSVVQT